MDKLKKIIDSTLKNILPSPSRRPKKLHVAMRYSVLSPGKRIRPMITIEAARACGAAYSPAVFAGCAIELVHAYSLIHDDLPAMDDDDFRRGRPSCHRKFGEDTAILAGDALLPLAFGVIARKFPPDTAAKMIAEFADAAGSLGMAGGQAMDLEKVKHPRAGLDAINELKTGKLFLIASRFGALAAGAGAHELKALTIYGTKIGAAFQTADDILDKENYKNEAGKTALVKKCSRAISDAKKAVKIFGPRAAGLERIADMVLEQVA